MVKKSRMTMIPPTAMRIFQAVVAYKKQHDGCAPSLADLMTACNIGSKSTISRHLATLAQMGLILIPRHGASRSIAVVGGKWTWEPKMNSA